MKIKNRIHEMKKKTTTKNIIHTRPIEISYIRYMTILTNLFILSIPISPALLTSLTS